MAQPFLKKSLKMNLIATTTMYLHCSITNYKYRNKTENSAEYPTIYGCILAGVELKYKFGNKNYEQVGLQLVRITCISWLAFS